MTETKLTWHHPLCEGECFACLIERTIKKEYGEVGLRYLLKQINDAPVQQAEQGPVAIIEKEAGFETEVYATGHADSLPDGVFKLYAAPVRTKDLTDDEIEKTYDEICRNASSSERLLFRFARAVIAADREKNK